MQTLEAREVQMIVGTPLVVHGVQFELLASGYLHAPGGANASTASLRITRGEQTQQLMLGREHPGALQYQTVHGMQIALVQADPYQQPNRAVLMVNR